MTCVDVTAIVDVPLSDRSAQRAYLHEALRAQGHGAKVYVRGFAGRIHHAPGVEVVREGAPHRVRLSDSPNVWQDPRLIATCQRCGRVGRYNGPPHSTRPMWNPVGLLEDVPVMTIPDWEVDVAAGDVQWLEAPTCVS